VHPREHDGRSGTWRTAAQLALGMVVFGSATPVSKIVTGAVPPFVGSLVRVAIGALALLPFALARWSSVRAMSRADWLRTAVIALFGMFGFTVLMLYGMRSVSGVAGAIVMSTTPAVTATASVLFLGDRASWRVLTAVALAVAGVLVLHLGGGTGGAEEPGSWLGVLLVFGAVLCEACYTLLGKRVTRDVDPLVVAFLAAALAVPAFVPFALWQASEFEPGAVGPRAWTALAWYGAGTLALGSWLWYSGVARARGAVAAGFMGLMPASALGLSYVLLDEPFRWVHPLGFATVFAGVLLISWEHARAHGADAEGS
jgi:drug/metabolite transporter (DMT)-like permease